MLNIKISDITKERRKRLKTLQDEFMTFSWGGVDAFETFGAFIINEKNGSLKFYNGPGFSNEYTKPQFDSSGGILQGVTFNKQSISFNIGVYWISIEDYRQLINWLHPLKIDYLQFGFNKEYRYDVKLSKIADSTRWIVGKENGEPRYYTELQLSFDIQGEPCAKGVIPYEFVSDAQNNKLWDFVQEGQESKSVVGSCFLKTNYKTTTERFVPSDLDTPLQVNFILNLEADELNASYFYKTFGLSVLGSFENSTAIFSNKNKKNEEVAKFNGSTAELLAIVDDNNAEYDISLSIAHTRPNITTQQEETTEFSLCSMTLQHFALFVKERYTLNFTYFSETGLVFLQTNNSGLGEILTLQTFTDSGEFLVKSLQSSKFMLPGVFNYPDFYDEQNKLKLILRYSKRTFDGINWSTERINPSCYEQHISIECYPRTNII